MARPIVALLTDFGTRDPYVAAMKGVVLGICPEATLVDLTHDIPAHDIAAGARALAACVPYYPAGTIFVAVVDPGVGGGRRALAADTGAHRFVGPDNGLLSAAFDLETPRAVVELSDRRYQRPTVSRTFEGRDRFAPAAGHLAAGVAVRALGRAVQGFARLTVPEPVVSSVAIEGVVVDVDRFGNLVTNIPRAAVEHLLSGGPIDITIDGRAVPRLVGTYGEAPAGAACALFGSTDHLEIAVNGASAAAQSGAGRTSVVAVRRPGAV
ncbi:MAG: SAM-dependent chlorinase/fluorinase [Vicinamibacterales bacterium]